MEAPVPSSGLYTCLACQVAFESADGQRIHYRSDWHRYNLKRKVADLPPVTLEQFQQKQKGSITRSIHTSFAYSFLFIIAVKEADAPENKPEPFKGHCSACK